MYILTRAELLENCQNNEYWVQDTELEKQYMEAGYHRYERSYNIKENYRENNVICPEFRNKAKEKEPIVITPEFVVPGRPYPAYVYLYAIELYSSSPEKGQRQVAEETRKKFRLTTFAHTTVGRALKAFTHIIAGNTTTPEESDAETISGDKKRSFPSRQWTAKLRKRAAEFLYEITGLTGRRQIVTACCKVVRKWFKKNRCFLL